MKPDRFRDLDEVRTHKLALRAERDRSLHALRGQLELVGDPAFRRGLIGDAFGDLLRAWKPLKHVGNMLGGSSGAASSAMGAFLGAKAQTPMGRMLIALAGIVLPAMADRVVQGTAGRDRLRQELGVSWARVKQYLNERRKAHQEHRTE